MTFVMLLGTQTRTNFNCKAVEVTEIEKTNGCKNRQWRRRIKKHDVPKNGRFCFAAIKNIAGRLPANSRNRFVDRQSKKTVKKTDQKTCLFIEG